MTRYSISHRTDFEYSRPVAISHHLMHLTPRATEFQAVEGWSIRLSPNSAVRNRSRDFFGNHVEHVTIQDEHDRLVVQAEGRVEVSAPPVPTPGTSLRWEEARLGASDALDKVAADALAAQPFAYASPMTRCSQEVVDWVRRSFPEGRPLLEGALDLNHRIFTEFEYDPSATTISTPVDTVFEMRKGVCQDFAHLMLAGLRGLGLPSRYVSGYLLTYPPPGGVKLQGSDASHAWVSVRVPDHGWVDLDPTNDKFTTLEHITLAWGRDYGDVSPVRGAIVGGGRHEVKVAVDVRPVDAPVVLEPSAG